MIFGKDELFDFHGYRTSRGVSELGVHFIWITSSVIVIFKQKTIHVVHDCLLFYVYFNHKKMFILSNIVRRWSTWFVRRCSSWLKVSFAEYRVFYRALLQKRPIILPILLTKATPYWGMKHLMSSVEIDRYVGMSFYVYFYLSFYVFFCFDQIFCLSCLASGFVKLMSSYNMNIFIMYTPFSS